ncbi:MFS transporter [Conexibacter sp. JD483]|uniref:MFS transporter n=1 Tax=unclassified Conexibacter TaxID=2627773 RepID=UPI0027258FDD|nr:MULTISPECIES: MFS transporter [unclassified Conexibacter]MDO8185220.1 MFS transporter [Conexibacter sp. CPCC 205706]MDO8198266.1 MFS transporter [Conexibacter sp. CPCC 205762]MDR9367772.1 MFS transporter [Conexibacter sp. JD483]
MPRSLVLLFAVACGLAVGSAYAAQPLLDAIADALALPLGAAGIVVTATQAGLALGLLLVVPLGDLLDRRRLVACQLTVGALALTLVALAPSAPLLLLGAVLVGASSVVTQVLVAYAAVLAAPAERGRVVGIVTSGVVSGILLARVVAGVVADLAGWRAVYLLAAGLTVVVGLLLVRRLPRTAAAPPAGAAASPTSVPGGAASYAALLRSTVALVAREPLLRARGGLALLTFAAFSTLWSALVLPLSAPPHGLSHAQVGLFGVAGLAGALGAARAGRLADRGRGQRTTGVALALLLASWAPIALLDRSLLALAAGIVVLDFAVQAVHVSSQSMLLAALPVAGSRAIAAYMAFYSAGSALGAIAATSAYAAAGWGGVCLQGAVLSLVALCWWALTQATPRRSLR